MFLSENTRVEEGLCPGPVTGRRKARACTGPLWEQRWRSHQAVTPFVLQLLVVLFFFSLMGLLSSHLTPHVRYPSSAKGALPQGA